MQTILEKVNDSRIDYYLGFMSLLISEIYYSSVLKGIFFRGAISCGKFYSDGQMLIGPAVDDAASFFEISNFFAVICSPSASFKVRNALSLMNTRKLEDPFGSYFIEHDVPIKSKNTVSETSKKLMVVDWPKMFIERVETAEAKLCNESFANGKPINKMNYIDYINMYFSNYPIPFEAIDKYEHTLKFMEKSFNLMNTERSSRDREKRKKK